MKKTLTILAGHPRGGEATWSTLYENVLTPLDSDLAICTGSKWLNEQSFLDKAQYQWIIEEPKNWFDYYEKHFNGSWREYFEQGLDTGLYNSGSIHFAIKDIILKNHINDIKNYTQIIYTRFDQFYTYEHPKLDNKRIWIPKGEDYFGICDRHAVVPVDDIEKYLDICSFIDSKSAINSDIEYLNCEVAYKEQLIFNGLSNKVARFDRLQFTSAKKGDKTNWRIPKYKVFLYSGLQLKYPQEFIDSIGNYLKNHSSLNALINLKSLFVYFLYLQLRRKLGKS
jgi:hypothetical protein